MSISFDPRTAQFHDNSNRRFIPRRQVLDMVDNEVEALKEVLQGYARLAISGTLTTSKFQTRVATLIKEHHLRMTVLAAGGRKQTTSAQLGATGRRLRNDYIRLARFGRDMSEGQLSEKQILNRTSQYAETIRTSFFDTEKRTRATLGFNQAKRELDPNAQHCPECLIHSDGIWKEIGDVVPIGAKCSCVGRCRCLISYRRFN